MLWNCRKMIGEKLNASNIIQLLDSFIGSKSDKDSSEPTNDHGKKEYIVKKEPKLEDIYPLDMPVKSSHKILLKKEDQFKHINLSSLDRDVLNINDDNMLNEEKYDSTRDLFKDARENRKDVSVNKTVNIPSSKEIVNDITSVSRALDDILTTYAKTEHNGEDIIINSNEIDVNEIDDIIDVDDLVELVDAPIEKIFCKLNEVNGKKQGVAHSLRKHTLSSDYIQNIDSMKPNTKKCKVNGILKRPEKMSIGNMDTPMTKITEKQSEKCSLQRQKISSMENHSINLETKIVKEAKLDDIIQDSNKSNEIKAKYCVRNTTAKPTTKNSLRKQKLSLEVVQTTDTKNSMSKQFKKESNSQESNAIKEFIVKDSGEDIACKQSDKSNEESLLERKNSSQVLKNTKTKNAMSKKHTIEGDSHESKKIPEIEVEDKAKKYLDAQNDKYSLRKSKNPPEESCDRESEKINTKKYIKEENLNESNNIKTDNTNHRTKDNELVGRKIKGLFDIGWCSGRINYYNFKLKEYKVTYSDKSTDYITKEDIDGVELILDDDNTISTSSTFNKGAVKVDEPAKANKTKNSKSIKESSGPQNVDVEKQKFNDGDIVWVKWDRTWYASKICNFEDVPRKYQGEISKMYKGAPMSAYFIVQFLVDDSFTKTHKSKVEFLGVDDSVDALRKKDDPKAFSKAIKEKNRASR